MYNSPLKIFCFSNHAQQVLDVITPRYGVRFLGTSPWISSRTTIELVSFAADVTTVKEASIEPEYHKLAIQFDSLE